MKKILNWLKEWWFSIFCFVMAIVIPIYTIIAINLFEEELLIYLLVLLSCITPSLMFIVLGVANQPKKESKNE